MMRSGLLKLRESLCGFLLAAAALLLCQPAFAEKRVALVLGNSTYQNVPPLSNPINDGGLMAVRANTQVKLDQYVFNGREDGNERSLLSLIKGGFRTITGLIGNRNKDNYRIVTPNATIGIRGTDHEPVVIPAGAPGGFQAGTYDRVYRGATIIETDKGKLIVTPVLNCLRASSSSKSRWRSRARPTSMPVSI